jgi:polynucleotide 5'-hydroxyl-kinase GRC3/NOL9
MIQDLMLAGVFAVTPLQRSIGVFSATLDSSHQSIPIFAPTSHPLPIISPINSAEDSAQRSPILARLKLPSRFAVAESHGALRTLFLIRGLQTGITGLKGGVVPGFNNIWLDDRGMWGIHGVHPVSHASKNLTSYFCRLQLDCTYFKD